MERLTSNRINRIDMFFEFVDTLSKRSTCPRKQVGAVLVRDNRVIAMGYNGTLPNIHPTHGIDPETGQSKTVHAEANIVAFCAKNGIRTKGTTLYISLSPCEKCAELIIQAGITLVLFKEEYRDRTGIEIIEKQGIACHQYIK